MHSPRTPVFIYSFFKATDLKEKYIHNLVLVLNRWNKRHKGKKSNLPKITWNSTWGVVLVVGCGEKAISDKIALQKTLQRSRKTVYSLIIFNDTTWTPATFQRHGI